MAAWRFEGDEIFVALDDDEVDFQRFSCRFETIEKVVDILTGEERVVVKITNSYSNPCITLARESLSETTIVDILTKYGVSVSNQNAVRRIVKEILIETEADANINLLFNKLGFVNINGEEMFLADRLYSATPTIYASAVCASSEMKPRGTFNEYRDFLLNEVCKYPKLSLALALGVTAPVAHILKKYGVFYETLLWSFCGESSSGKTTSLLMMLSQFGNPQYLLSNLNATSNALAAQVSAQSGFPFVADEATRSKVDFDELIYSLSSGKGKRRCNGDGRVKELVNFSGAAFFSSEQPILDKCTQQGGEEARVIEFELNWFDGDDKKAENFLDFFNNHYGVAIEPLANLILEKDIQKKIIKHFKKAKESISEKVLIRDGIDKRIIQRLAIIAVAAWLLQKAIKVDLHIEAIVELLIEIFEDKQTRICRTKGEELLIQLFVEDYIHNKSNYADNPSIKKGVHHQRFELQYTKSSIRGMVSKFQGRDCLWIPMDIFNEILAKQSTYGSNTAKKKLHNKGYLKKFGNSYYQWFNFGATSANAYCVFLPENTVEQEIVAAEINDTPLKIEAPSKLVAGFVSLTSQSCAMVLNLELAQQFKIKKSKNLFLHVWGAKEFLVLSNKVSEGAIKLNFQKIESSFVATDDRLLDALKAANLSIKRCERLLLTDIKIQSSKSTSAIIYTANPHGQWGGQINDKSPYDTEDVYPNKKVKHSLLDIA